MNWKKAGGYAVASDCGQYFINWAHVMGALVFSAVAGSTIIATARAEDPRNAAQVSAAKRACADACEKHARGLLRPAQR